MSATAPVLGLLGAGNIASAMVAGWCSADPAMGERIVVTDRGSGRAAALAERHGLRHVAANADVVAAADIVVLCVKPVDIEKVLREVSGLVTPRKSIASVAAGVGTATLETILDVDAPVFRFMPNVGVRVGAGTLAFSAGRFNDTAAEQAVLEAEFDDRFSNPYAAAERGFVDEVLAASDTRRVLAAALGRVLTKREHPGPHRHANTPL